jgi:hypothetical protein
VILLDANLLIYAHVGFAQHGAARDWLDEQLSGTAAVGFPWPSLLGFLRVVTNPRAFERPEPISAGVGPGQGMARLRKRLDPSSGGAPRRSPGQAVQRSCRSRESSARCAPGGARDRAWACTLLDRWGFCPVSRAALEQSPADVTDQRRPLLRLRPCPPALVTHPSVVVRGVRPTRALCTSAASCASSSTGSNSSRGAVAAGHLQLVVNRAGWPPYRDIRSAGPALDWRFSIGHKSYSIDAHTSLN